MRYSITPIKNNSTRLPGKNHREFLGVPLVIRKMRQISPIFDVCFLMADASYRMIKGLYDMLPANVVVIDQHAWQLEEYGSNIRDRLKWWATEAMSHSPIDCRDPIALIHCTNPNVTEQSYYNAVTMWEDCPWMQDGTVVGCHRVYEHTWQECRGGIENVNHQPGDPHQYARDCLPLLIQDGSVFVQSAHNWATYGEFVHGKAYPYVVPDREVADIDTEADWVVAETRARAMDESGGPQ